MRAARFVLTILVAGLATWSAPRLARACSCMQPPPPAQAMDDAVAVFEGRTFRNTEVDDQWVLYEFEVTRFWKGDVGARVTIKSHRSSAACGRSFREGVNYVVYARARDGQLTDGLCSRTREIESASEDLKVLGAGTTPGTTPAGPTPEGDVPTEPPRIEPTEDPAPETGEDADPPPAEPGHRGCSVNDDRGGRGPVALWLVPVVALCGFRTVRSRFRSTGDAR